MVGQDNQLRLARLARQTKLFSKALYERCIEQGFQYAGQSEQEPFNSSNFTIFKTEGANIFILNVANLTLMAELDISPWYEKTKEWTSTVSAHYSSVLSVFLLAREYEGKKDNLPLAQEITAYHGQSPYSVFWHIDVPNLYIISLPHQPEDLFGLRNTVEGALLDYRENIRAEKIVQFQKREDESENTSDINRESDSNSATSPKGKFVSFNAYKAKLNPSWLRRTAKRISDIWLNYPRPFITYTLATVNLVVMILMFSAGFSDDSITIAVNFGAIVPELVWELGDFHRLFTSMFIHFGIVHLIMNGFGLFIFGTRLELYYGRNAFLLIYFISGLIGSIASLFLTAPYVVSAGASGAIYGLLGAAFAYTRYTGAPLETLIKLPLVLTL